MKYDLSALRDWELARLGTVEAIDVLRDRCRALALQRCGDIPALYTEQESVLTEMLADPESRARWQEEIANRARKEAKNRPDDLALLVARSGDEELAQRLYRELHQAALWLNRIVDSGAAENLQHETVCKLIVHKRALLVQHVLRSEHADRGTLCVGYARRTAANAAVDHSRRETREVAVAPTASQGDEGGPDHWVEDQGPDPEELVIAKDEIELLKLALNQLDPQDRIMLGMAHFENDSYSVIAKKTGLTANAVGVRLHRAKLRLRALITKGEKCELNGTR